MQEALACGLPVIASSRVGAGYDLIEAGGNGFVYPAGDDGMLALRVGEALALDPEAVRRRNAAILARWDYAATWRNLSPRRPEPWTAGRRASRICHDPSLKS